MKVEPESVAALPTWPRSDENRGRPLGGVKILDLSRILAGPYCAMMLADLGADVVKVEAPTGDETRRWGPPFFRGTAAYFFGVNRNKWDVVLDFTSDDDLLVLQTLIRQADVILHNFAGDTAQRFGVDYLSVAASNPTVIHMTLSGFGPREPNRRGYDLITQALGGIMAITGEPDGPAVKVGVPVSDLAAGMFAATGIASALFARSRSGTGAELHVSLYDATLALLPTQAMNWLLCETDTLRRGTEHPNVAPYGAFSTRKGSIVLTAGTDAQFDELCRVLGAPELPQNPMFKRNRNRVKHRQRLRAALEAKLARAEAGEWNRLLDQASIPNAAVRSVPEALAAPEAHCLTTVDHPALGRIPQVMSPIQVDGEYLQPYLAPPLLGEHTNQISRFGRSTPGNEL